MATMSQWENRPGRRQPKSFAITQWYTRHWIRRGPTQSRTIQINGMKKAVGFTSRYGIRIAEETDGWHVDYELKDTMSRGGGPHYVIHPVSGAIVAKRYEQ